MKTTYASERDTGKFRHLHEMEEAAHGEEDGTANKRISGKFLAVTLTDRVAGVFSYQYGNKKISRAEANGIIQTWRANNSR